MPFWAKMVKIGSIRAKDIRLRYLRVSTRLGKLNGASIKNPKITQSHTHIYIYAILVQNG